MFKGTVSTVNSKDSKSEIMTVSLNLIKPVVDYLDKYTLKTNKLNNYRVWLQVY